MRTYDNGTVSANRSAHYLQAVQDRIRRHASLNVPPAKTLEELAGDFFDKTAEYRAAVELHRVRNAVALLPGEDGRPAPRNLKAYAGYAMRNIFKSPDILGTEAAQLRSSDAIGNAIDKRIAASGGVPTNILSSKVRYETAKRLNDSIVALDQSLREYRSDIGMNKYTPTKGMEAALAQLEKTREAVAQAPELAEKFPAIDEENIKAPLGVMLTRSWVLRHLETYIDAISDFREGFNEFDVMRHHQELWEQRAAVCASCRLETEAVICSEVAEQFDHTYFEGLQKAWSERSIPWYSPR
jgi:hypothetical protein